MDNTNSTYSIIKNIIKNPLANKQSFNQIQQLIHNQQFIDNVINIACGYCTQGIQIRLCSAIIIKNFVKDYYYKRVVTNNSSLVIDKIKQNIFMCFSTDIESFKHLNPIFIDIVQNIAFYCYPNEWSNLFTLLFNQFQQQYTKLQQNIQQQHPKLLEYTIKMYICIQITCSTIGCIANSITKQKNIQTQIYNRVLEIDIISKHNLRYIIIKSIEQLINLFIILIDQNISQLQINQIKHIFKITQSLVIKTINYTLINQHSNQIIHILHNSLKLFASYLHRYENIQQKQYLQRIYYVYGVIWSFLDQYGCTLDVDITRNIIHGLSIITDQILILNLPYTEQFKIFQFIKLLFQCEINYQKLQSICTVNQVQQNRYILYAIMRSASYSELTHYKLLYDLQQQIVQFIYNQQSVLHIQLVLSCLYQCLDNAIKYDSIKQMDKLQIGLSILLQRLSSKSKQRRQHIWILLQIRIINILSKIYDKTIEMNRNRLDQQRLYRISEYCYRQIINNFQLYTMKLRIQLLISYYKFIINSFDISSRYFLQNSLVYSIEQFNLGILLSIFIKVAKQQASDQECLQILHYCHQIIGKSYLLFQNKILQNKLLISFSNQSNNTFTISQILSIYSNFIIQPNQQITKHNLFYSHFTNRDINTDNLQQKIRYGSLKLLQQIIRLCMKLQYHQNILTWIFDLANNIIMNIHKYLKQEMQLCMNQQAFMDVLKDILIYLLIIIRNNKQIYNIDNGRIECLKIDIGFMIYYLSMNISELGYKKQSIIVGQNQQFQFYDIDSLVDNLSIHQPLQTNIQNDKQPTMIRIYTQMYSKQYTVLANQSLINRLKYNQHNYFMKIIDIIQNTLPILYQILGNNPILNIQCNSNICQIGDILVLFVDIGNSILNNSEVYQFQFLQQIQIFKILILTFKYKLITINNTQQILNLFVNLINMIKIQYNSVYSQLLNIMIIQIHTLLINNGYLHQIQQYLSLLQLNLSSNLSSSLQLTQSQKQLFKIMTQYSQLKNINKILSKQKSLQLQMKDQNQQFDQNNQLRRGNSYINQICQYPTSNHKSNYKSVKKQARLIYFSNLLSLEGINS